jgi:hypothetical protein
MSETPDPLDADVMAVLSEAKPMQELPPGAGDRIWAAVHARTLLAPSGGGGGATGPRGPASWTAWVGKHPVVALVGAMLVGGAMGASARGGFDTHATRPDVATVAIPSSPPPAAPTSAWTETARAPVTSTAAPIQATTPAPVASHSGQQLAAESALLELARTGIAEGQAEHALAAVDRHTASFPQGLLREEREALAVKALVLAGRNDEARARAARFRARYPGSLFLPALESQIKSLP